MDLIDEIERDLNKLIRLDLDKLWFNSVDRKVKEFIIDFVTKKQLGEDGIDGDGQDLGEYAPYTIEIRSQAGKQTDHIDFNFTGWYWKTFKVVVDKFGFEVVSDADRFEELTVDLGFSKSHTELTRENLEIVYRIIRENYNREISLLL